MNIKENKYKENTIKVPCLKCTGETNSKIVYSREIHEVVENGNYMDWWDETSYQVVQCLGCDSISFRTIYSNIEMQGEFQMGNIEKEYDEAIYPKRTVSRKLLKDYNHLPPKVMKIYLETHHALNNDLTILAGIGIRALTEAVCLEKNTAGKDLKEKIENLAKEGILTVNDSAMIQKIRHLGNKAAHEIIPHDQQDLFLGLEILEHTLSGVYIYPKRSFSGEIPF